MSRLLIRALSTGRTGTKFLADAFLDQGYNSHHEDLYAGEPHVALHAYANFLGDLWSASPADYFAHQSGFAKVYLRTVSAEFEKAEAEGNSRAGLVGLLNKGALRKDVLLDWNNGLVLFTPLIDREAVAQNIDCKYLILYRNPLKTIHAIFKVEGQGNYAHRPASFPGTANHMGAARVWAHYYELMIDMKRQLGAERFVEVDLENFSKSSEERERVANFLALDWNEKRFEKFQKAELDKPLRSEKTPSSRNSDLYKDKQFSFSDEEIAEIVGVVEPLLAQFGIDEQRMIEDYKFFHSQQKEKLGFS
jgi:hypothetical protein